MTTSNSHGSDAVQCIGRIWYKYCHDPITICPVNNTNCVYMGKYPCQYIKQSNHSAFAFSFGHGNCWVSTGRSLGILVANYPAITTITAVIAVILVFWVLEH